MKLFSSITGHEYQKKLLTQLLKSGRVPHLMLFSGPESIGKFEMAVEFAKALLCKEEEFYCGNCEICRQQFDIHVIERDGSYIKINQLREMQSIAEEGPFRADRVIFLIRDAEYMNEEAMNSSLRIFEEPYPDVNIILITQNKTKLLQTIISRCFEIDFYHLREKEIISILKEKMGFSDEKTGEYINISESSLEFVSAVDSELFKKLYEDGTYRIYSMLINDCTILNITRVLDIISRKDILLFFRLFIGYLEKNMNNLINLLKDRYNHLMKLVISHMEMYTSYNLNETVFLESFLLRLKGVLENSHD